MIDQVTNADALPVLERLMQFAGARHRLIADAIANFDTPGHQAADLSTTSFRAALGDAIDQRRRRHGAVGGPLEPGETAELRFEPDRLEVSPAAAGRNILFHDHNDRDLDRTMQALVENFMTFRLAAQLLRSRFDIINTAIRERV
jgi:flagellar basal-body rod protein FlgB